MPDELSQSDIDALLTGSEATGAAGGEAGGLNQNELDALLDSAGKEEGAADKAKEAPAGAVPAALPALEAKPKGALKKDLEQMLMDISLNVRIELGRSFMKVGEVLKLNEGAVVELDKLAGDPVDVMVNDRLVAKGEVLILNEAFCVRITEIVNPKERLARNL